MNGAVESRGNRWLVYALGGGLGHLSRSLALARAAVRRGHQVRILSNCPEARVLPLAGPPWQGIHLELPAPGCNDREALSAWVASVLARGGFDVLVVDTFPRGLGGELAPLLAGIPAIRVLVHRDLNPRYVERFGLRDFVRAYDGLLVPGEAAPLDDLPHAVRTAPWLMLDPEELPGREEIRRDLGLDADGSAWVGIVVAGRPDEADLAARVARRARAIAGARILELEPVAASSGETVTDARTTVWPLLRILAGLDLLVGAGGYNTVHEARSVGTPLVAFAHPRLYDRQDRRLQSGERVRDEHEALERIEDWVRRPRQERGPVRYANGTRDAVAAIERIAAGAGARAYLGTHGAPGKSDQ